MRKLTRSVLKAKAYKARGGNKLFRMLWKDLRKKQGLSYPGSNKIKKLKAEKETDQSSQVKKKLSRIFRQRK